MAKQDEHIGIPRVSEQTSYVSSFPTKIKLEDYLGQDFILYKVRIVEKDKAEYAVFVARMDVDGQPLTFSCGGFAVVDYFSDPANVALLPMLASFRKEGAMWIME